MKGKKVVLTGTFVTMKRDEAEKILTAAGATVSGSISKSTDVLIHGENAGSKLAKATSLGIARMTEAEMVALLTEAGGGAEPIAGASEKLAKAKANAKPESAIESAVAELKVFLEGLKRRSDLTVTVAEIGRRATKAELASLKHKKGIPEELLELYAATNGVHIEWAFIEPPGQGCLRIFTLNDWTQFRGDDENCMSFPDEYDALLLDEQRAEGGTWLVREKATGASRLVFAQAAEGPDGVEPAGSIAAYLRAAMDHGFVPYWPSCFRENRYISYAEQEAAIERFRAPPEMPSLLHVGARVQLEYFSEGGRGEVLQRREAAPSRATEFCGRKLAEVKLDEGSVGWVPEKWMKVVKAPDAYERLRDPRFDFPAAAGDDLLGLMTDVARAVGPVQHFTSCNVGAYPSNARRAAGLLSARPLVEAITLVVDLFDAVQKAGLDLAEKRPIAKSGQEFSTIELARHSFEYSLEGTFAGLLGGLFLRACHESARCGVVGRDLVDGALRSRIPADQASSLIAALTAGDVLAAPIWHHDTTGDTARALGLPEGAAVLQGSGF
ncbi:MAG: BRCT domain-containing protein [Byssovorax sp.]